MPHDARAVANEFITRAFDAYRPIDHLQTLKLVYFSHAWMLAIHDRPLVEQTFEAWKLGPVVPDLYHELKHHGWKPIYEPIKDVPDEDYDEYELNIIDQVSERYGKFSGTYLSALTHGIGTPWHQVWKPDKRNIRIPDKMIKDYYRAQLNG